MCIGILLEQIGAVISNLTLEIKMSATNFKSCPSVYLI